MNFKFLKEYETWLIVFRKRNQNSRTHNFVAIQKYLNLVIKYGITKTYPFQEVKFSTSSSEIDFLDEKEIIMLQKLYDSNQLSLKHQKTLANFLFTCYTGIAGDDLKNKQRLTFTEDYVIFERGKTKKPVKVPLTKLAKRMVPEVLKYG